MISLNHFFKRITGASFRAPLVALAVLGSACFQVAGQGTTAPFSSEVLETEARAALTAVGEARGVKLWGEVPVRLATRDQVEAAFRAEQSSFLGRFAGAEGHTELDFKQLARWALCTYANTEKAILVVPENFVEQAKATGRGWLLERDNLRVILVHEAVHAADDRQWNLGERMRAAKDEDALKALSAVMEGHAQLITRRVCKQNGWTEAFERMTSFIGSGKGELQLALQQLAPVRWPTVEATYLDGEAFMTRVLEAGGAESVARAFLNPPEELQMISRPDWFLDPRTRPPLKFDFDSALDYVAGGFDLKQWTQVRTSATLSQLRDDMDARSKEQLDGWIQGIVRNRAASFKPKVSPESKALGATLFEHASARQAGDAVALKQADSRRKDARLADAALVRVVRSDYATVEQENCRGYVCRKRLRVSAEEIEVMHVVLSSGPVEVELRSLGGMVAQPAAVALAITVLKRCQDSGMQDK